MSKNQLLESVSIIELEDRFETSVVGADFERCSGNSLNLDVTP